MVAVPTSETAKEMSEAHLVDEAGFPHSKTAFEIWIVVEAKAVPAETISDLQASPSTLI